jgi:hypothetical protein
LIVNGSFENTSIEPGSFQDVPAGSTAITGWTVTGNHIDLIGGLWTAAAGRHSLDLEGSACNTGSIDGCLGGVAQTFATKRTPCTARHQVKSRPARSRYHSGV